MMSLELQHSPISPAARNRASTTLSSSAHHDTCPVMNPPANQRTLRHQPSCLELHLHVSSM